MEIYSVQLSQQQLSQLSWLNSALTQLRESRLNQAKLSYYGDLFLAVSKGNGQAMIILRDLCVSSAVIPFGN